MGGCGLASSRQFFWDGLSWADFVGSLAYLHLRWGAGWSRKTSAIPSLAQAAWTPRMVAADFSESKGERARPLKSWNQCALLPPRPAGHGKLQDQARFKGKRNSLRFSVGWTAKDCGCFCNLQRPASVVSSSSQDEQFCCEHSSACLLTITGPFLLGMFPGGESLGYKECLHLACIDPIGPHKA